MNDLDFVTDGTRKKTVLEETIQEIEQTPQEYLPNLLQIVRLFRESVTLPSAESRACHQLGVLTLVANNAQSIK
jgi:hypothetical protein